MADAVAYDSNFENIINGNNYRFSVGLVSADGRYQELKIASINSLSIEDQFTEFYHKGYIIINNRYDGVERIADVKNREKLTTSSSFVPDKGFIFRGDSRDYLFIDIMPKLNDTPFNLNDDEKAYKSFRLLFTFSIYNTEEIAGELPGEKFKKLYFWDLHYDILRNKNAYFSTSNYIKKSEINTLSNAERGIPTGTAIKHFLEEFFNKDDGLSIYFKEDEFDTGSTSVFFSSPARFKGLDCLKYLLSRHVSDANNNFDQGFLRKSRSDGTFSLQSLSTYFKKALTENSQSIGQYFLETFKLGEYSDVNNEFVIESVSFTPPNALYLGKYGTISNFVYDPMPGEYTQQDLVTTLVHSYNFDEKSFNIDQDRNTIMSVLSVYGKNYVEPFNKLCPDDNAYLNFYPGEYRLQQKNVKNVLAVVEVNADQRLAAGRNKAIFNNIFLNNTVLFKIPGSTHRQAGRFIGINRDGATAYSDFDSKILGVYFVLEVKHLFEGNDYYNELRCVKTYSYDNLFLNTNSR